jgi:O-antigen/teichoic acid export membrane protein
MNYATLVKNALLYSIGTIAIRSASFLLIPIYTYSLSAADYGLLSVLLQTAQILVVFVSLGSKQALVRFAKESELKGELGLLIGTSVFINLVGAALVTITCGALLLPLFRDILHTQYVFRYVVLTCAAASMNCLSFHLMSYYRAEHKGVSVTLANVCTAVGLFVLTGVLVRLMHWGIDGALIAQTVSYGLLSLFFLIDIASKIHLGISARLILSLIRFGLPLILVMSGTLATQTSALYFLSHFGGLAQVGIYSLGFKLAAVADMILILPFQMAYEPFVYGQIGEPRLWRTISRLLTYLMLAFTFLASAIVFIARDALVLIAPSTFSPAYLITFLVVPTLAFKGVYYIGESLLFIEKRTDIAGTVVTFFSLLSIGLNYLCIRQWGMFGAAAVSMFTTVSTGAVAMRIGLSFAPVRIERDRLCAAAALLFGLLAVVYAVQSEGAVVYYSTVPVAMCVGALALFISGFIRSDEKRILLQLIGRPRELRSMQDV